MSQKKESNPDKCFKIKSKFRSIFVNATRFYVNPIYLSTDNTKSRRYLKMCPTFCKKNLVLISMLCAELAIYKCVRGGTTNSFDWSKPKLHLSKQVIIITNHNKCQLIKRSQKIEMPPLKSDVKLIIDLKTPSQFAKHSHLSFGLVSKSLCFGFDLCTNHWYICYFCMSHGQRQWCKCNSRVVHRWICHGGNISMESALNMCLCVCVLRPPPNI